MKKYRNFIIILVIIAIASIAGYNVLNKARNRQRERTNDDCKITERLFDYADKLNDREEAKLRDLIAEYEQKLSMDIVIITLEDGEDFSDIGLGSKYYGSSQTLSETFCDYYMVGWEDWSTNHYQATTSIVIAANWTTGDAWMCTSGRAKNQISNSRVSDVVQGGCEFLRNDPLRGFTFMIEKTAKAMQGFPVIPIPVVVLGCIIISAIFFAANYSKPAGKNTTTCETYVEGGAAKILNRQDVFIRKTVTHRTISSSSGGGGGGGGGGSHGGGGGHF